MLTSERDEAGELISKEISKGLSKECEILFYPEENVGSLMAFSSHIINISAKCHFFRDVFPDHLIQNERPSSSVLSSFIFLCWHCLLLFIYILDICLMSNFLIFPLEFKLHISENFIFLLLLLFLFTAVFPEPIILPGNKHFLNEYWYSEHMNCI